ncbi:hypothetical protein IWQ60_006684 [Tieghemiomyces parasiticus]|uniref:UBX domain-containing protein n=1 Tax=Tieghemiomyces parasiticus TaxID=78921 RepID=A0A9W8A9A1_9FUNG|nr:hypothetical protein IWQ60_006684 [Tieghemiomyces parasiticus]
MPLHRLEEVLDPNDFAEKLCASKGTVPGSQRRDFSTPPNPPFLAEPTSPPPLGGNEPQLPSVPAARPAATPDTAPSSPPQATVTTAATAGSTRPSPIIATPVEGAIASSPKDASASPTTAEPAIKADPEEPTSSPAPRALPTPHTQLLVRLLDGSVLRTRFVAAKTTLGDVDDYIREHRTDGTAPYYLMQVYPRRQYTSEQYSCTLAELDLCPSGTLVLKPAPESTVRRSLLNPMVGNTAHANTVAERSVLFFAWCFSYTQLIGAFVCGLFRRLFGTTTSPSDDRDDSPAPETATSTARRPTIRHGPRVRTVHSAPDSDSERDTTYNGNSTNMRP